MIKITNESKTLLLNVKEIKKNAGDDIDYKINSNIELICTKIITNDIFSQCQQYLNIFNKTVNNNVLYERNNINLKLMDTNNKIVALFNSLDNKYAITDENKKKIKLYSEIKYNFHNKKFILHFFQEKQIQKTFIDDIIFQIYIMFTLYGDKEIMLEQSSNGKKIVGPFDAYITNSMTEINSNEFIFYFILYHGPRKSSKNINHGNINVDIMKLKNNICFYNSSGLTDYIHNNYNQNYIIVSRMNGLFGLLNHELCHALHLDCIPGIEILLHNNNNDNIMSLYLNEIFSNFNASIFVTLINSLLYFGNSTYNIFKKLLKIEIIHSFNQYIRLLHMYGFNNYHELINYNDKITNGEYVNAYVIGRALMFNNINIILKYINYDKKIFFVNNNNNVSSIQQCFSDILLDKKSIDFFNTLFNCNKKIINTGNDEGINYCGNMLMEYFCIDFDYNNNNNNINNNNNNNKNTLQLY